MRRDKIVELSLVLCVSILLFLGCGKQTLSIAGEVVNERGEHIPGAFVSLEHGNLQREQTATDQDGKYSFRVEIGYLDWFKRVQLIVNKGGYRTWVKNLSSEEMKSQNQKVILKDL